MHVLLFLPELHELLWGSLRMEGIGITKVAMVDHSVTGYSAERAVVVRRVAVLSISGLIGSYWQKAIRLFGTERGVSCGFGY
jgi:hypothetical protein